MYFKRKPTTLEISIIQQLLTKSGIHLNANWENQLLVASMNDSGMGSLKLSVDDENNSFRQFGREVSQLSFIDTDGIEVLVSLFVDKQENLFELDVWKTDFSELLSFPFAK